jgi:hypothetical protein
VKVAAFILAFILLFFTIQPLFGTPKEVSKMQCCRKGHCSKKGEKKDNCENKGCNPFMACAYGNYFIAVKPFISTIPSIIIKEKRVLIKDNYSSTYLSDCWHPPELACSY